ncbi:MAG: RNA polymerase sigma factor [Vicinamibacterales bacterium]
MSEPPAARRAGRFATTRWSLVLAAGARGRAGSVEALSSLCEVYWYPAYAFIRRQGYRSEECADLTQAFFTRVLEKDYFRGLDPARGRFRAFLCTALRHFLANERDRVRALKRGGPVPPLSIDVVAAEAAYRLEPRDDETPETLFDRGWALALLERVLRRLQEEQASSRKKAIFERLKGVLTGDFETVRYATIAGELGMTEGAVKVAAHRLRRHFRDLLVEEIGETVADPAEIDAEIAYLLRAVSR